MSFTEDTVKTKLSQLNESQESIVSVAQWIMFHKRHAQKTSEIWLQRMKEADSRKRVTLIYLANEVCQQSKVRNKMEFIHSFSPIIAEGTAIALQSSADIQGKIKRVIEVWGQRQVFDPATQAAIEQRLSEVEQTRSSGKGKLGGSLFSSSSSGVPSELASLVPLQNAVSKANVTAGPAMKKVETEQGAVHPEGQPPPSNPVKAARLSSLLKALGSAENAVNEGIKAREKLVQELEKLVEENKATLKTERQKALEMKQRREDVNSQHSEVENEIMAGLSGDGGHDVEPERPEMEGFTPPPEDPSGEANGGSTTPTEAPPQNPFSFEDYRGAPNESAQQDISSTQLRSATDPRLAHKDPRLATMNGNGSSMAGAKRASPDGEADTAPKRQKSNSQSEEAAALEGFGGNDAMDGLDEEVVGMLGSS